MKDRIRAIMDSVHMTQQEFANKLGISPASLSSIFTGRTNPTNNHVLAIHRAFPEIDVNWLMFGEGDMYANPDKKKMTNSDTVLQNAATSVAPDLFGTASDSDCVAPGTMSSVGAYSGSDMSTYGQTDSIAEAATIDNRLRHTPRPVYGPQGSDGQRVEAIKVIDRPIRRIKEIRVFYDDGTFEAFVPAQ